MTPLRSPFRLSLLAALALLSGCGAGRAASPFDGRTSTATRLTLAVENQNYNDVRVYVVSIQGRRSLGVVTGNSSETFRFEWRTVDAIRIRMEFLAGQNMETNQVTAGPGDQLELIITASPRNTILRRR